MGERDVGNLGLNITNPALSSYIRCLNTIAVNSSSLDGR